MTELHAENLRKSVSETIAAFESAKAAGSWDIAEKCLRALCFWADTAIGVSRRTAQEADALAAELQLYRPTRDQRPPAPLLPGYCYVESGQYAWACVAVEHRQVVVNTEWHYTQEHYAPDKKTLCGRKNHFPINERFESGGWPRLHELCPKCAEILLARGLLTATPGEVPR